MLLPLDLQVKKMSDKREKRLRVMDSLLIMMEEERLFLNSDLTAEMLATKCRCTLREFTRIVLDETGITPEQIIATYREQFNHNTEHLPRFG